MSVATGLIVLYSILGLALVAIACRYVPGFKCISWCKIRQFKYDRAKKRILNMTEHSGMGRNMRVSCDNYSTEVLIKLYKESEPFACSSFRDNSLLMQARDIIKQTIAERHLLEA